MTSKRSLADMLRNQMQVETKHLSPLEELFEEEPPSLKVFIKDKKYLNQDPFYLSDIQEEFVLHFQQILSPETYILMVEEFGEHWMPTRFVNELSAEWGKGGGKDFTCQVAESRVANLLLCMKNPQAYYGMPYQTIIHIMNVAASSGQAHGVFFKPLRTLITKSPFFADKFEGDEPGPQATEIRFKKQIELISGHSSAETLEGKNLLAAIADEISAFPTLTESRFSKTGRTPAKSAEAIIEMLRSSATTRFAQWYKLAQISYPRFKGDAIQQATAKGNASIAKNGEASIYYVSGPHKTWDVNPRYATIERIEVPGAEEPIPNVPSIVEDYTENPTFAAAKYECNPDVAENRYFGNDVVIYATFDKVIPDPVTVEYYWGVDEEENWQKDEDSAPIKQKEAWQVRFTFSPDLYPVRGALYAIHGDMAIRKDRAGVAMSHVKQWEKRVWKKADGSETNEARPIVKNDFTTSFSADLGATLPTGAKAPREVQLRWYRKLIFELQRRGFVIGYVSFDQFQSTDTMQILESRGIATGLLSTDKSNKAWETLRDLMNEGRLDAYWQPNLVEEIRRLNQLPNGRVDHPPDGSKDEADSLAGSLVGAIGLGGDEGDEATAERADTPSGIDLFNVGPALDTPAGMSDFQMGSGQGSLGLDRGTFGM